jgi:hypothetical protein
MALLPKDLIYAQIYVDKFVVLNANSGIKNVVPRDQKSESPRMLIADFDKAEHELRKAVRPVLRGFRLPDILIHPMERIEGGLTEIEFRCLNELGASVASRVGVYTGPSLSSDAVRIEANGKLLKLKDLRARMSCESDDRQGKSGHLRGELVQDEVSQSDLHDSCADIGREVDESTMAVGESGVAFTRKVGDKADSFSASSERHYDLETMVQEASDLEEFVMQILSSGDGTEERVKTNNK